MNDDSSMIVDATGLACPMPLLKTKLALADVDVGDMITVLATDEGSLTDIPRFVSRVGHELVRLEHNCKPYRFVIRKDAQ